MNTNDLLANTEKLFEALHVFQFEPALRPTKKHFASHIQLIDFSFNKDHLIRQLRNAITSWVFNKSDAREIFKKELADHKGDYGAASAELYNAARETIRISAPQGQFGELLLAGFLQHLFKAVPLLRKQPIRTSDKHERFGADAIHYSNQAGERLFLGESKCYKSSYQFPSALTASLTSICDTLENFSSEIRKFSVGGFIQDELKETARNVISNKIPNLTIQPVVIIIYNETKKIVEDSAEEYRLAIKSSIIDQCEKITDDTYDALSETALNRLTYIIMPVWGLDDILTKFVAAL